MLIEVFGDKYRMQELANKLGEPVDFYESEQCVRWYEDIQCNRHWELVGERLRALSYHFRLVIHDGMIETLGPSIFLQPGAGWDASYRVEMENGCYRVLDESWGCDEDEEYGWNLPVFRHVMCRYQDGVLHDPPLFLENDDANGEAYSNRESMIVYQCGDDWSDAPMLAEQLASAFLVTPTVTAPQPRCILPDTVEPIDWATDGF